MSKDKIVSILDIGTNSVLMLLSKCCENGSTEPINEYIATTMLGENLKENGDLNPASMNRTVEAISEMLDICKKEKIDDLIVTATSVVRNAKNRSSFLLECHRLLNIYPLVLSGKEEARFVYKGVSSNIPEDDPIVLIDIGGGSSEIAWGYKENLVGAHSFKLGTIKLGDQFKLKGKFHSRRRKNAQAFIEETVAPIHKELAPWLIEHKPRILMSSGTGLSYAAVIKKEYVYDRDQINGTSSDYKELLYWAKYLWKLNQEDRMKVPGLEKERVDTLPVGLLMMTTIMKMFDFNKFYITTDGLREGVLAHYIEQGFKL